jgi:Lon protease-like protein
MTERIPLFPLPGVVLLPGTLLPLHIFEPRYRAMVADALSGDRTIGMAMMKPGWERAGRNPAIYPVGGAGRIVDSEELPDGRYDIVLQGEFRYRVLEESAPAPYRVARVERIPSVSFADPLERARTVREAASLFAELAGVMELAPLPETDLPAERLASELAIRLRFDPAQLQAILEADSIKLRFQALLSRMREWKSRIAFLSPFRRVADDPGRN